MLSLKGRIQFILIIAIGLDVVMMIAALDLLLVKC